MAKFWLIVADQHDARIYETGSPKQTPARVREIESNIARAKEHELGSDRPGRVFSSATRARHALDPEQKIKDRQADRFARLLARAASRAWWKFSGELPG
jgi:hypothetical protein